MHASAFKSLTEPRENNSTGFLYFMCADKGRPAFDPVVLFECLLLGYLCSISSERQRLELRLTNKVLDVSTSSQNRRQTSRFSPRHGRFSTALGGSDDMELDRYFISDHAGVFPVTLTNIEAQPFDGQATIEYL